MVDSLKNSSSPYVKFVGTAVNILAIVNDVYNGVKSAIDLVDTVKSFVTIIEDTINKVKDTFTNPGKGATTASELQQLKIKIRSEINKIKECIKSQISEVLIKELRAALRKIINGAIGLFVRSSTEGSIGRMQSQFKGQDPVAIARMEAAIQHAESHTKRVMELSQGTTDPNKLAERLRKENLKNAVGVLKTTPFIERCQKQLQSLRISGDVIDRLAEVRSEADLRSLGEDILKSTAKRVGTEFAAQMGSKVLQSEAAKDLKKGIQELGDGIQKIGKDLGVGIQNMSSDLGTGIQKMGKEFRRIAEQGGIGAAIENISNFNLDELAKNAKKSKKQAF